MSISTSVEPVTVPLPRLMMEPVVRAALLEDLGRAGDLTTDAIVPADAMARAQLRTRQPGVLAGLGLAQLAFELIDPSVGVRTRLRDGQRMAAGDIIADIEGPARAVLTAERVALNFLCHLSGIASATAQIADALKGTRARVTCTRKTTPGLRALQKYAVRVGGGSNHRFGLDDAILIKDNHVSLAGGIRPAVMRARAGAGHLVRIELEVDTLDQLDEALEMGVDVIMLDNMGPDMLREAVRRIDGRAIAEASGGITPDTARAVAETGVDLISVGWLTHSVRILDIGLDI